MRLWRPARNSAPAAVRPPGSRPEEDAPRPGGRRAGVALALAVSLAGAGAVHGERFVRNLPRAHWEDFRFFRHERAHVPTFASCLGAPSQWPGLYRPLATNCYYHAGRLLFDHRLEAYHAVNGALFVGNGVLLFVVARAVLPGGWPLLVTALFVTRRAHAQLTLYTSEAQALLSTSFALGALALLLRPRPGLRARVAAGTLFFAALLSKETVIVLPAILFAYRRLFVPGERFPPPAEMVAPALAYGALFAAARARGGHEPTGFDYDLSFAALPRLAAHAVDFSNRLIEGTPHVDMPATVVHAAYSTPAVAATALLAAAMAAAVVASRRRVLPAGSRALAFGLAWWVVAAAPFLFFHNRLFMRYSYFAHAGLAIAVSSAAAWAWHAARARVASRSDPPLAEAGGERLAPARG